MASGSLTVLITPQSNYIVSPSRNTGSPVVISPQSNYVVSTDRTVVSQVQPASRYVDSARVAVSASYATNSDISISSSFAEVSNTSSYADNFNVDGAVTASTFTGDGSLLTGIVAQGVGILIDEDSIVQGVAERLDFQDGLDVTVFGGTGSISLNRTGSFSGSFSGDGSGITNVASALYAVSSSHLSGGNAENIGYVDFDTTYVPGTHTTGRFYWDDANKTAALDMFGSDVRLQLGQEQHLYVRNNSGVTINNGDAVRITGASGNNITVEKALSTIGGILNQNSGEVIGVATENIDNNSNGYVTTYGTVNDIDTSTLTEGSEVYVSSVVSGAIVGEQPPAPYEEIQIGVVEKSHPTIGKLFVRPQRGVHFSEIATVTGSNLPVGNSYLEYDSVTGITSFVDTVQSSSTAATSSYVEHLNQIVAVTGSINVTGSGVITEDMILRKEDQQVLFRSVITRNVYSETRQIEPTIPTSSYSGCQIEYHITKASATRQGVVLGTWLNGQINYTDISNLGIGDSNDLNFDMILSSGQAILRAVSSGTDSQPWQIHTFLKTFSNIV